MARIRLDVDGSTLMDADLGKWTSEPPQILREQLAANSAPKPYMRCVLMIVADAAMTDTETRIIVTTTDEAWTMTVGGL